jgi:hypothetical protein
VTGNAAQTNPEPEGALPDGAQPEQAPPEQAPPEQAAPGNTSASDSRAASHPAGTGAGKDGSGRQEPGWPSRRLVSAWFACFSLYAGLLAAFTRHEDCAWGVWAVGSDAIAAVLLRFGRSWWPGLLVALTGGLLGPFVFLATQEADAAEVKVIGRGAAHLLAYGTPYLPASQLTSWYSYNPYLPLMDLFGLPRAAGLHGRFGGPLGDPRVYTSLVTIALLAASFVVMARHSVQACRQCRARAARMTVIIAASPVIAFPLALGITDPPVIAVTILALACMSRGWLLRAALALAAACALKYTAWPEVPVFAAMAWVRYSPRRAILFTGTTLAAAAALALAAAPNALSDTTSVVQNTLDYPLGLTKIKTVAASPLPGHVIASLGPAGHAAAVALLLLAGLAFAAWLVRRPPATYRAVAVRLAVAYVLMFTLAPASRFGYYIYPLALLFWLILTEYSATPQRPFKLGPLRLTISPGTPLGRLSEQLSSLLGDQRPHQVPARARF